MKHIAQGRKLILPATAAVGAAVDLGPTERGFGLAVRMSVSLPDIDATVASDLIAAADAICPYSNAIRNNIPVSIRLV